MSGTRSSRRSGLIEDRRSAKSDDDISFPGRRASRHANGDQRVVRLPETVVTKFLTESGRSLRCQ
jgi:hypothetical protein